MKKGSTKKSLKEMATAEENSAKYYLKRPYARILIPEENGLFSAEILEFPGCYSQGASPNEAFENLEKAAVSWIEAALDTGQEIPAPSVNHGYSGKIALRLSRSLHRLAVRKAERDRISLNQCLVTAIATWVGADNFYERLMNRIQPLIQVNIANTNNTINAVHLDPATYSSGWFGRTHTLFVDSGDATLSGSGARLNFHKGVVMPALNPPTLTLHGRDA
jgi:predicted RNase H-like HicB family nuclease